MTLEASVLATDSLRRTDAGYQIDVYLPWYRSLPLSCMEALSVTIGDQKFEGEQIQYVFHGNIVSLADIQTHDDEDWFVQDALTAHINCDAPLEKGTSTPLNVNVVVRIPYIIIGPNMALPYVANVSKEVVVQ